MTTIEKKLKNEFKRFIFGLILSGFGVPSFLDILKLLMGELQGFYLMSYSPLLFSLSLASSVMGILFILDYIIEKIRLARI